MSVPTWSVTTLREKLIKIGAKIIRRGRYVTLQKAEIAIPGELVAAIPHPTNRLRPAPVPTRVTLSEAPPWGFTT